MLRDAYLGHRRQQVSDSLEGEIEAIARRLAAAGDGRQVGAFHLGWWSEQMLEWAFTHAEFKTQLFRFVDVFPRCRDAEDVLRHLSEYFDGVPVPRAVELGLDVAEQVPLGRVVSAAVARRNIRRMARQFIAAEDAQGAVAGLRRLWDQGEAITVDLLGERVVSDDEAQRYADRIVELVDVLSAGTSGWPAREVLERDPWGVLPRVDVSVKPTALSPLFAPVTGAEALDAATARMRPVLDRARAGAATVHLDTEHDEAKDLGYELLRRLGRDHPDVQLGCVVQAYRKDSYADLHDLVAWSATDLHVPLRIRLVKGAYWDHEEIVADSAGWPSPVFAQKSETDANFERCTKFLIDHAGEVRPAIAQPQPAQPRPRDRVRRAARARLPARVELQLLYGMAEPVHAALVRDGHRVRVYVPVGELVPGIAYLVRRLLENTSNESFVRHRFAEGKDLDLLIRAPAVDPDRLDEPPPRHSGPRPTRPRRAPFTNEPLAELRRAGARAGLTGAVRDAADQLGFVAPVLVDGQAVATDREIVSVDPGCFDRVVCRSGWADRSIVDAAIDVAASAWPAWRGAPWTRASRDPVPGGRRSCARDGASWRRWRSSRPGSRSPRPTPTCARRSTSASTTDERHSACRAARGSDRSPAKPTRTPTSHSESVR